MAHMLANDNLMRRIEELVTDGYLERDVKNPRMVILTPKGLGVLLCEAERPTRKEALAKEWEARR